MLTGLVAGLLAQLGDRALQLGGGLLQRRAHRVVQVGPVAQHREREGHRDEALLRAVVQVPFDAPPLPVAGLDDPLPGCPHLLQLRADLRAQAFVRDRHAGGGTGCADEVGLERRIVDQRR